jgi:hypothetical protein
MKYIVIFIFALSLQFSFGQTKSLNAYEYVIVPMKFDFQSESNQYSLNILARVLFQEEGFKVYMDKEERPLEYRGNTCEPLFLEVEDTSGFLRISTIVRLKDCYDNVLFESEEGVSKIKDFKEGYQQALRMAFSSLTESRNSVATQNVPKGSSSSEEAYPDKKIYKFGGETYWLIESGTKGYRILFNGGKVNYAELQSADKGSYIFNSKSINGAAYFDVEGNINIEYMDEDLGEIQNITFRKAN